MRLSIHIDGINYTGIPNLISTTFFTLPGLGSVLLESTSVMACDIKYVPSADECKTKYFSIRIARTRIYKLLNNYFEIT